MPTPTSRKPTKMDLLWKVLNLVDAGRFDDQLSLIVDTTITRQKVVREQTRRRNMVELSAPGTRVRIRGNVKPKYLLGLTGEVVERPVAVFRHKDGMLYVKLDRGAVGRYGSTIGVPASALEAE